MNAIAIATVNGQPLEVREVAATRFIPGDGVYPDETLYVTVTDQGSYLLGAGSFNVDPSTLPVTEIANVWR